MSKGLKKSMRAWHRWLGLFTSIQLLLWTVSGLFFTVPDITDVRGEQYRVTEDYLEVAPESNNLVPIQNIVTNGNDFMEENFVISLRKRAQSWVYQVQSDNRKTLIFDAISGDPLNRITETEAIWIVSNQFL